MDAEIDLVGL